MNKLKLIIYNLLPKRLRYKFGKSRILAPIRNSFFRRDGVFKEVLVNINRDYLGMRVKFDFFASIQVANKAKVKGIENTLLKNSLKLLNTMTNDKIIFDIGSNFGYLSLVWANTVCKHGKVYSFEPHPILFKSFTKSVSSNFLEKNIISENIALGKKLDFIELNLASTTSNVLDIRNNPSYYKTEKVNMNSLDLYIELNKIEKCDLIKIDTDGTEYDILKGSHSLIKKLKPIVVVETNNDTRIIDFFRTHDYNILNMDLNVISENEMPVNIFCLPNN